MEERLARQLRAHLVEQRLDRLDAGLARVGDEGGDGARIGLEVELQLQLELEPGLLGLGRGLGLWVVGLLLCRCDKWMGW